MCKMTIGDLILSFPIHIVDADIPILFSLADMNHNSVQFFNLDSKLVHKPTGAFANVTLNFFSSLCDLESSYSVHVHYW